MKNKKTKINKLDDKETFKKILFENISKYKKQDLVFLKKNFDLEYDIECLRTICKKDTRIGLVQYMYELGIKPDLQCLADFIPGICGHRNVHSILEMAVN